MFRKIIFIPLLIIALASGLSAGLVPGRYIVELDTEPLAEHVARLPLRGRMQSPGAAAHRATLRSEQGRVRARLEQRRARILGSVTTVANALFIEISGESAMQLAAVPGVRRVLPVRTYHMVLNRAVLLHRVADVWNRIGQDHAGEGIKIAIIDSGIQANHPAFRDESLKAPAGYPRANSESDLASTSGKIIVARSYVSLLQRRDPDGSPQDRVGHGTALAMIAAGIRNGGTRATITGVAPKAFLGNYKVFGSPGVNDGSTDDAIIKAIDDAVADGMDVINLSLGADVAPRLDQDLAVQAVERAVKSGVIVVAAAGNNGPDFTTISSPATAPSVIAVGATTNDRKFASSVEVPGSGFLLAIAGSSGAAAPAVTAPLTDVSTLDAADGLACAALPSGSLAGRIALILRGTCTFEAKLTNAQQAGAVAAVVYATRESPSPFAMGTGTATLPAEMVSHEDGVKLKEAARSSPVITLNFAVSEVPWQANRIIDFSAAGPSVDSGIKPDLMAVGGDIYTATQTFDSRGDMFSQSGFILVDGTSFSSPLVAGAAALLKSARPGLSTEHYRSLLINTATEAFSLTGGQTSVQETGAGVMDVDAAFRSTVAAYPVSMSLGGGGADLKQTRSLFLTNLGSQHESFDISVEPRAGESIAALSGASVGIPQGGAVEVPVNWAGTALAAGAHEGFLVVRGTSSGSTLRIPYWYGVVSSTAARITLLEALSAGRRGSVHRDAILFRVTGKAGLPITSPAPEVTVASAEGTVRGVVSHDSEIPGLFGVSVELGLTPGPAVFRITAGEVTRDVSITVQ